MMEFQFVLPIIRFLKKHTPNTLNLFQVLCGVLFILSCSGTFAEDRIAADTQFNGNLALTTGGEYAIAEKGWEEFLKKFPENSQCAHAKHYLAICKSHTQHFAEAEAIFEKELKESSFPNVDESLFFLGVTFVNHAQSFPTQMTGSRLGTVNTVGDRSHSISPEATELYRRAIAQFQKLRASFPDSKFRMDAAFYEALAFIQLGSYENALGDLKLVVATRHFSDLNRALYAMAEVYLNLPVPQEKNALVTLQTLLENQPEPGLRLRTRRLLGDVLYKMEDYAGAEAQFQAIHDDSEFQVWLDPKKEVSSVLNLAFFLYRRGETYMKLKRYSEAAETFARIPAEFPESTVILHALYQQALAMKNYNMGLAAGEKSPFNSTECAELWQKILSDPRVKNDRSLYRSTVHQLTLYFIKNGNPQKALETVEEIPAKLRTSTLLRDCADALAGCGRNDEAIAVYRQIFQKNQTPKTLLNGADAMLQVIWIYRKAKDFPSVIQTTSEMIVWDGFKRLPEVMQMTFLEENTQAYYESGDFATAREGWERLLKNFSKCGNPDSWRVSIAYCFQKSGKSRDGFQFVLKNVKKVHGEAEAVEIRHLGGVCYRDYSQTKKTSKLQTKYLSRAQNQLIKAKNAAKKTKYASLDLLYYDLSQVYFLQKNYEKCVKNIQWGLKLCPESPIADQLFFLKGRCEVEAGNLESAAETFETFLTKFPESPNGPEAGLLASQCFLKLNQTEKAVKLAKEMAQRFPNSNFQERGANVQAIAAMEAADYDSAMEAWNVILKSDSEEFKPLRPEAKYEIGFCLFEKKDFAQAEKTFRNLLEEFPDWDSHERTYNQLVKVLLEEKKLQEAQDALAGMSGKFPESVFLRPLMFQLGTYWFLDGKMEEAEITFRPIVKNPAENSDFILRGAQVKTAWTFFNRNMFHETIDFIKSIELEPKISEETTEKEKSEILANCAELRFLEAMAFYKLKNLSQALKEFQTLKQNPNLAPLFRENTLEMEAQIYEEQEKWESVLDASAEFLEIYPDSAGKSRMQFKRTMAFFRLQRFDEALELCDLLQNINDPLFTPQSIFLKGEILFAQKQYETAIQAYYQVIYGIEEPKLQADAMFEAAQCFEMLEKTEKALKLYHDLLEKYPDCDKVKQAKRKMKKLND